MPADPNSDLLRDQGLMSALGLAKAGGAPAGVQLIQPTAEPSQPGAAAPPQPVANMDIPAPGRALLATIGGPGFESNGTYTQRFNQPDFTDFSKHPATMGRIESGPDKGNVSNAAGRYQLISTTFADQAQKKGLTDFSPKSQDAAAWNLAQETYAAKYKGRDLAQDLQDPKNLPRIADALKSQWSSLPGGRQPSAAGLKGFANAFAANLKGEAARTAQPAGGPSAVDRLVMARGGLGA